MLLSHAAYAVEGYRNSDPQLAVNDSRQGLKSLVDHPDVELKIGIINESSVNNTVGGCMSPVITENTFGTVDRPLTCHPAWRWEIGNAELTSHRGRERIIDGE